MVMKLQLLITLLPLVVFFAGCSVRKEKVEGRILVIRRDGEAYAMGQVTVELFADNRINPYLLKTTADLARKLANLKAEVASLNAEKQDLLQRQTIAFSRLDVAKNNYEMAKDLADAARRQIVSQCRIKGDANWTVDTRPFFSESDKQALNAAANTLATAAAIQMKINQLNSEATQAAAQGDSEMQRQKLQEATIDAHHLSNLDATGAADTKQKLEEKQRQVMEKQAVWDKLYPEYQNRLSEVAKLLKSVHEAEAEADILNDRLPQTQQSLDKCARQLQLWPQDAPQAYFDDLPSPLARSETDANGHFSFRLPRQGSFILTAEAQRMTSDHSIEEYFWLIRLHSDGNRVFRLELSNDDLITSKPADAAVPFPAP